VRFQLGNFLDKIIALTHPNPDILFYEWLKLVMYEHMIIIITSFSISTILLLMGALSICLYIKYNIVLKRISNFSLNVNLLLLTCYSSILNYRCEL